MADATGGARVFTYGSLLDRGTTLGRAQAARRWRRAELTDWALAFRHGVADVRPAPGRRVPGGVWLVSEADLDALDRYEGISAGVYSRYQLPVRTSHGEIWAWCYVMPPGPGERGLPTPGYLRTVAEGLQQWGWPTAELDRAVREASPGAV